MHRNVLQVKVTPSFCDRLSARRRQTKPNQLHSRTQQKRGCLRLKPSTVWSCIRPRSASEINFWFTATFGRKFKGNRDVQRQVHEFWPGQQKAVVRTGKNPRRKQRLAPCPTRPRIVSDKVAPKLPPSRTMIASLKVSTVTHSRSHNSKRPLLGQKNNHW